jgi:hypothetical protein
LALAEGKPQGMGQIFAVGSGENQHTYEGHHPCEAKDASVAELIGNGAKYRTS